MSITGRLSIVASCVLWIGLAPSARADYVGLEVVERTDLTICQDQTAPEIPFKLEVCEVYAVFDAPADRVISVAFTNVSTTDPAGFYQHSLNFRNTAPACALIALEPTLVCDSFITIGLECSPDPTPEDPTPDATTPDVDFSTFEFASNGQVVGGWFNAAPPNGQGVPDANGRVLVARFSYKQSKTTTGSVCLFTQLSGSKDIVEFLLEPFDCSVPNGDLPTGSGSGGGSGGGGSECPTGMIWYVDVDPIVPSDGACCLGSAGCNGWANACPDLQLVLDQIGVDSGDQIWVAEGTYRPSDCAPSCVETDRSDSFQLASCLGIYGGFEGNEDPVTFDLDDRDFVANETTLSGEIQLDGFDLNNSYHVVNAGSLTSSMDGTAILDGFTVTKGSASAPDPGAPNGTDKGSAVSIWLNSTPLLENCNFYFNYALDHGGVNDHGGAKITNCLFDHNHAHLLGGGGLYVHSNIGTTVTDCVFNDNWSHGSGGGVYIKVGASGPEPTFTNCTFTANFAPDGGAFYSGVGRSPILSNCTFSANTTIELESAGAAMYIDGGNPTVSNCAFTGNSTAGGGVGGAMYVNDGAAPLIEDCTFTGNSVGSGDAGGAMYLKAGSDPLIQGCTFTSNLGGGCGGAIYMGELSTPKIRDCEFIANSAASPFALYGGAIYSEGATSEVVNCGFRDNVARYGGAIVQLGTDGGPNPNMDVINCTFVNNEASVSPYAGASGGGAIWGFNGGSLQLTNCLFVGNRVTSVVGSERGGAAGVTNSTALIAANCTFVANSAADDGGGIWIGTLPNPNNVLDNCVFWANTDNGGLNDDESAQISFAVSAPTVNYSDIMNVVQEGIFCPDVTGEPPTCDNRNIGWDPGTPQNPGPHYPKFVRDPDPGPDMIWGTADDDYGDLHPTAGSPCIDAGSNLTVPDDIGDLNGDTDITERTSMDLDPKPRFLEDPDTLDTGLDDQPDYPDVVDMGAYEFAPDCGTCPTDVDGDGETSAFDLAILLGFWGHPITNAGALCLDADGDLTLGAFDLASLLGAWGTCQ